MQSRPTGEVSGGRQLVASQAASTALCIEAKFSSDIAAGGLSTTARLVQSLVFGVEAGSMAQLATVAAVLTALALAATLVPAISATRADPVQAIKIE